MSAYMNCGNCGAELQDDEIEWEYEPDDSDVDGYCPHCGSNDLEQPE